MIKQQITEIENNKQYSVKNNKRISNNYNSNETAKRIKNLCKDKGISLTEFQQKCGLSKSFIYDLEKRAVSPSCQRITVIADYLNCSVDYLLGRTDDPISTETSHETNNFMIVTSQEELDRIPHDSKDIVVIKFGTYDQPAEIHDRVNVVVTGNYYVKAYGNSSIIANNGCDLELYGSSKAKVFVDCGVVAHDNSRVDAFDIYSVIKAFDNSLIRTIETPVFLHNKSKVIVYGDRPCEVHHEFDDNDLPY